MKIQYKQEIHSNDKISISEIISHLLKNREISNLDSFLHPPSPLDISLKDFGFDQEITKVIEMLKKIKENGETIVVYTDYDADGITGGAILWETLYLMGFKVFPYVPHRKLEGYGFSLKGIDAVKEKYNPGLIISVDHGIAAVDQIAHAKSIGIPVIVTDHHHKQERIPEDAEVIFHIPALSGSGVAYFFAKEIFNDYKLAITNYELLKKYFEIDYLALASIGTIADLVPLTGASRSVVKYGLQAFSKIQRKGITCILKEAGIEDGKTISPYEVGFVIAPRINAIGRLEHAIDALRLLCTTNEQRARELAGKVGNVNTERQELVKHAVEEAQIQVEKLKVNGQLPRLIILHSKDWHEGIIGLIASKIVEQYYRPTIVMTENDGNMKGSARSIVAFHITDFFTSIKDFFVNYGGHRQAAGFSLLKEKLEEFQKIAVEKTSVLISDADLERTVEVDLKIPLATISMNLAREIDMMSPFGIGNPQASFVSDVQIVTVQLFGKNSEHLKITVKDPQQKIVPLEMIKFSAAEDYDKLSRGQNIQIAYQIDINRWNGRETLRGKILQFGF